MAFSKAKILRFNDINNCVPAPGAYNPKYEEILIKTPCKTPSRQKKDQIEPPSPANSCTDVKSVKSCITSFRTPTIPKRKKLALFSSSGKKSSSVKLFSPEKEEELREKIVECNNKDETIKDLGVQVEELKLQINALNVENADLKEERNNATCQIEDFLKKYEESKLELEDIKKRNDETLNHLFLLKEELNETRKCRDITIPLMEQRLEEKSKYCESLEEEIEENRHEITKLKIQHNEEIDNIIFVKIEALEELRAVQLELNDVIRQLSETKVENEEIKHNFEFLQRGFQEIKESQDIIRPLLEEKLEKKTEYCDTLEQEINDREEEITEINMKHEEEIDTITAEKDQALAQLEIMKLELENINIDNDLKETYVLLEQPYFEEYELLLKDTSEKLESKTKYCEELQNQLEETIKDNDSLKKYYNESLQTQADLQSWYATTIDSFKKEYCTEIEDLEYELLKTLTESDKKLSKKECNLLLNALETKYEQIIQQITLDYEAQVAKIRNDFEASVKQSEEDSLEKIKLTEIQMEEKCNELKRNWEHKFQEQEAKSTEILKECQAIAEFNIIQCEVEKNEIAKKFDENQELLHNLNMENEVLTLENSGLKTKMSKIIIELNNARSKLGSEIDLRQKDLEIALTEKHCYEITLNKTYNTVNALKTRLLHSDSDVEQLKEELELLEISKIDLETKYIQVCEELQHIKKINEHLKCENLLLKEIQDKVIVLERELLEKVDNLKLKSDLEICNLNKIISEKQTSLEQLNSFIKSQQTLQSDIQNTVVDAKNEIERQEAEFIEYKFKITRLESSQNNLSKNYEVQEKTLKEKMKYINELEDKLLEKDKQMDEITDTYKKYVDKTKNLTDLHQKHEVLVQKCLNLEKMIAEQKKIAEPFRNLMKSKGTKIVENKIEYEEKITQQNKTIEKLKQEIAHLSKTKRRSKSVADKENVCSPVRSQIINIDTASPLKERN